MEDDTRSQVERYRLLVLRYEALDQEIDDLIMSYGGVAEKMPPEALEKYRQLARERSDVQNELRRLEQKLMDEDD